LNRYFWNKRRIKRFNKVNTNAQTIIEPTINKLAKKKFSIICGSTSKIKIADKTKVTAANTARKMVLKNLFL
jgi:hypothetical protein